MEQHDVVINTQAFIEDDYYNNNSSSTEVINATNLLEKQFQQTTKQRIELFRKREILLEAISKFHILSLISLSGSREWEYRQLSKEFLNDREVVIAGLKKSVYQYSELSDDLKRDREVILAAVQGDLIDGFQNVPDDLKQDKELVCKVLEISAFSLSYLSTELRSDPEVVLKAISTSGLAIQFASDELRRDINLVIKALKQRPQALEYIDFDIIKSIVSDRKCLEEIISENPYALTDFIGQSYTWSENFNLDSDKGLLKIALEKTKEPRFLYQMNASVKQDKEFIMELLEITKEIYRYLGDELKNDPEIKEKAGIQ